MEFYKHKKPRKLLDQVSDVMCVKHYSFRAELSYISWNKLSDRKPDGIYGVWESRAAQDLWEKTLTVSAKEPC